MALGVYTIVFDPLVVRKDISRLDAFWKITIQVAVAEKLTARPEVFGKPLRQSLAGWRSLRIGDYRVVYEIDRKTVHVLGILHRSEVYREITKRLSMQ